jgi:uncharacterized protein with PQ loop repeat
MTELLGWIGGTMLATCVIPQVIQCIRDGHSDGLNSIMLWMWGLGEVFMTLYVLPTGKLPLIANYFVNFALLMVIVWYKVFPRRVNGNCEA